ncbi:hypothetical protein V7S43_018508 [Phytophthora oleae]|uniref:Uncharacterized protein n=1 Tax=Phytophthora oleae TaxID=2107226 RepID=A0ABD3EQN9_9STRA
MQHVAQIAFDNVEQHLATTYNLTATFAGLLGVTPRSLRCSLHFPSICVITHNGRQLGAVLPQFLRKSGGVRQWVLANGGGFLVEEHIPLETWNGYVARNTLPQARVSAETVWLVELSLPR